MEKRFFSTSTHTQLAHPVRADGGSHVPRAAMRVIRCVFSSFLWIFATSRADGAGAERSLYRESELFGYRGAGRHTGKVRATEKVPRVSLTHLWPATTDPRYRRGVRGSASTTTNGPVPHGFKTPAGRLLVNLRTAREPGVTLRGLKKHGALRVSPGRWRGETRVASMSALAPAEGSIVSCRGERCS